MGIGQITLGRNEPCHCGSGKKYRKCCLAADEEAALHPRAAQFKPEPRDDNHRAVRDTP